MLAAKEAFDEIRNAGQVEYLQPRIDEFAPMAKGLRISAR
jgi:hypothetical protein